MASVDMAPKCWRCSQRAGREVRHFYGESHYGRLRIWWARRRHR